MPKRGSRRLAKKASGKSRRRESQPNVYVADTRSEPEERTEDSQISSQRKPVAVDSAPSGTAAARPAARPRIGRGQQVRARSEVYAQYLPLELRKLGVLSSVMLVALILLMVFLR